MNSKPNIVLCTIIVVALTTFLRIKRASRNGNVLERVLRKATGLRATAYDSGVSNAFDSIDKPFHT